MSTGPVVVVGGGLAAGTAVVELRELGYDGEIVLYADEPHLPYERPPLSKGFLAGRTGVEETYVKPAEWYAANNVDVHTGTRVASIHLGEKVVHSADGVQRFSRLLLATGVRARTIPTLPTGGVTVGYLRNLADAELLRSQLRGGLRLLVVGGGWIGMEVAATARTAGAEVTVVEPAEQPLLRALGPELGQRLADLHRSHGVDVRVGTSLTGLRDRRALLSDGTAIEVDRVVIGIGTATNDALAKLAGLTVSNGIDVDAALRTSHPDVYAAGDVANLLHPVIGERLRVEHWQNAVSQGKAVARSMLGEPVRFEELPSFFSDQYDLGLEYFGHAGAPGTARLTIEPGSSPDGLVALWRRGDAVVAALHVNEWDRSAELAEQVRAGHASPQRRSSAG